MERLSINSSCMLRLLFKKSVVVKRRVADVRRKLKLQQVIEQGV
jgi:hypothetical protein